MKMVPDALWTILEPLIPPPPSHARGGRPRVPDRAALAGILFVLRTGCPWAYLPSEMGWGSGTTCWRRLRDWQAAGVWQRLERELLNRLGDADAIDWSRAALDSTTVPAKRGAKSPGRLQRIAANRARSATWWSTPRASRSRMSSRART
jgi:transposase